MAQIRLVDITKNFQEIPAVRGVHLDVSDGEFFTIVGPSGCGKSTLLRLIAGLDSPSRGMVTIGERDVTGLPPAERNVSLVFQNYALYPHMTVYENIAFPLRVSKVLDSEVDRKVREAAVKLHISSLLEKVPGQLSGGERQRTAVGRAMVRDPEVFLFDEPLSTLDVALRIRMRDQIKKLSKELNATFIYVTHDQVEAMTLSDRIAVMNHGMVRQIGSPEEIYQRPADRFVAGFFGSPPMNFLEGKVSDDKFICGDLVLPCPRSAGQLPGNVVAGVRPEHVQMRTLEESSSEGWHSIRCDFSDNLGNDAFVTFEWNGQPMKTRITTGGIPQSGDPLQFRLDPSTLHFFHPNDEGTRLNP